jgi:hypothetical protein
MVEFPTAPRNDKAISCVPGFPEVDVNGAEKLFVVPSTRVGEIY